MTSGPQCRLGPDGCLEPQSVGPVNRESTPPRSEGEGGGGEWEGLAGSWDSREEVQRR